MAEYSDMTEMTAGQRELKDSDVFSQQRLQLEHWNETTVSRLMTVSFTNVL